MPNVMAAQPNIGDALCESSGIPFLEPRRKVWLMPAAGVPCSNANAANIEGKTWTQRWILHLAKFRHGARAPENVYYSVPAQETAKHRAKLGWPPVSDVAAVMKPRRETCWNLLGAPNSPTDLSR